MDMHFLPLLFSGPDSSNVLFRYNAVFSLLCILFYLIFPCLSPVHPTKMSEELANNCLEANQTAQNKSFFPLFLKRSQKLYHHLYIPHTYKSKHQKASANLESE